MPTTTHALLKVRDGAKLENVRESAIKTWSLRETDPDCIFVLPSTAGAPYATLNAYTINAILAYLGQMPTEIGMVKVGNNKYAVEQVLPTGETIVASLEPNAFRACQVKMSGRYEAFPPIEQTGTTDLTALFALVMMRTTDEFSEVKDSLEQLKSEYAANAGTFTDEMRKRVYYICSAVEYALNQRVVAAKVTAGNIDMLTQNTVTMGTLNGTVVFGTPRLLAGASGVVGSTNAQVTVKAAKNEFAAWRDAWEYSEQEKKLIPQFEDSLIVPAEVMMIARRYVATQELPRPMVNFLWRASTGYGKSTGVAILACILGMPLLTMTCHPDITTEDFLSTYVPVEKVELSGEQNIPTADDILYDPVGSYEDLTGESDPAATPQMCLDALRDVWCSSCGDGTPKFKLVDSRYVKAMSHRYIIEIQECSRPRKPGVLVGLNDFDKPGALIPRADGSYVKRHPAALAVFTDNVEYASCNAVDQSFLRRMAMIIDSRDMSKKDALRRVRRNIGGFADENLLDLMYDVYKSIVQYCAEREITEGGLSIDALEMWALCVKLDGYTNVLENCKQCVVTKATSSISEQDEINSSVLAVKLGF